MTSKPTAAARLAIILLVGLLVPAGVLGQSADDEIDIQPTEWRAPLWIGLKMKTSEDGPGAEVTQKYRRSAADNNEIEVGDRIVAIGGTAVKSATEASEAIQARERGDEVKVAVVRGKERMEQKAVIEVKPDFSKIRNQHLIGFDAPPFEYVTVVDGRTKRLRGLRGKVTLVEFWATWCEPCRDVHEQMNELQDEYSGRVNIISVSTEGRDFLAQWGMVKKSKVTMVAADSSVSADYVVNAIPIVYLLDADHRVLGIIQGVDEIAEIKADIDKALDRPVETRRRN